MISISDAYCEDHTLKYEEDQPSFSEMSRGVDEIICHPKNSPNHKILGNESVLLINKEIKSLIFIDFKKYSLMFYQKEHALRRKTSLTIKSCTPQISDNSISDAKLKSCKNRDLSNTS
jgi:hypothetical protein